MATNSDRSLSPLTEYEYSTTVQLWLKIDSDSDWFSALIIPIDEFINFTLRPLKWLRFLGFTIFGRQGVLYTSPNGPEVDDYMSGVESLQDNYYYYSPDEHRLLDVHGINDRKSDAYSHFHTSQADFADEIIERDGTCVLSDTPRLYCDAAHLIPHAKGDEYIERLTRFRQETGDDVVEEISDVRNGVLLIKTLHVDMGSGLSAFLKTPNFALGPDDVPPSPRPVMNPSGRFTFQYFHDPHPTIAVAACNNQDARPPADQTKWPLSILTDAFYGGAVVKKWGSHDCRERLASVEDKYYKHEPPHQGSAKRNRDEHDRDRSERAERRRAQRDEPIAGHGKQKKQGRGVSSGQEEREIGDIMDLLMFFWTRRGTSQLQVQQGLPHRDVINERVVEWMQAQQANDS